MEHIAKSRRLSAGNSTPDAIFALSANHHMVML
jgi:hypothetical protein